MTMRQVGLLYVKMAVYRAVCLYTALFLFIFLDKAHCPNLYSDLFVYWLKQRCLCRVRAFGGCHKNYIFFSLQHCHCLLCSIQVKNLLLKQKHVYLKNGGIDQNLLLHNNLTESRWAKLPLLILVYERLVINLQEIKVELNLPLNFN